jgi:hypothetical protein
MDNVPNQTLWIQSYAQALVIANPQMSPYQAEIMAEHAWRNMILPGTAGLSRAHSAGNWPPAASYQGFKNAIGQRHQSVVAGMGKPPGTGGPFGMASLTDDADNALGGAQEHGSDGAERRMDWWAVSPEEVETFFGPDNGSKDDDEPSATEQTSKPTAQAARNGPNPIPFAVDREGSIFGPRSQQTLLDRARERGELFSIEGEVNGGHDRYEGGKGKGKSKGKGRGRGRGKK